MTFQAYLDTVKAKTGKTPDDFRRLAKEKGLVKFGEVVSWLKTDFELGHGHANAVAQLIVNPEKFKAAPTDMLASHFATSKDKWRAPFDKFCIQISKFGNDVSFKPNLTYINILRGSKKIGIVQISSAERIDIGIKLKGAPTTERFEPAGAWNNMVTHRVRITNAKELNAEVIKWMKQAYDTA